MPRLRQFDPNLEVFFADMDDYVLVKLGRSLFHGVDIEHFDEFVATPVPSAGVRLASPTRIRAHKRRVDYRFRRRPS